MYLKTEVSLIFGLGSAVKLAWHSLWPWSIGAIAWGHLTALSIGDYVSGHISPHRVVRMSKPRAHPLFYLSVSTALWGMQLPCLQPVVEAHGGER